jgi:hypothetical protein
VADESTVVAMLSMALTRSKRVVDGIGIVLSRVVMEEAMAVQTDTEALTDAADSSTGA